MLKASELEKIVQVMSHLEQKGMHDESFEMFLKYIKKNINTDIQDLFDPSTEQRDLPLINNKCNYFISYCFNQLQTKGPSYQSKIDQKNSQKFSNIKIRNNIKDIFQVQEKVIIRAEISNLVSKKQYKRIKGVYFNNMGIYSLKILEEYGLALQFFEQACDLLQECINLPQKKLEINISNKNNNGQGNLNNQINNPLQLIYSVSLNNLVILHYLFGNLQQAEQLVLKSISLGESSVFGDINNFHMSLLQDNEKFLQKLNVLIYSYLYCECVHRQMQLENQKAQYNRQKIPYEQQFNSDFIKNAYNFSKKYYGQNHPLSVKIYSYKHKYIPKELDGQNHKQEEQFFPFQINNEKIQYWKTFTKLASFKDQTCSIFSSNFTSNNNTDTQQSLQTGRTQNSNQNQNELDNQNKFNTINRPQTATNRTNKLILNANNTNTPRQNQNKTSNFNTLTKDEDIYNQQEQNDNMNNSNEKFQNQNFFKSNKDKQENQSIQNQEDKQLLIQQQKQIETLSKTLEQLQAQIIQNNQNINQNQNNQNQNQNQQQNNIYNPNNYQNQNNNNNNQQNYNNVQQNQYQQENNNNNDNNNHIQQNKQNINNTSNNNSMQNAYNNTTNASNNYNNNNQNLNYANINIIEEQTLSHQNSNQLLQSNSQQPSSIQENGQSQNLNQVSPQYINGMVSSNNSSLSQNSFLQSQKLQKQQMQFQQNQQKNSNLNKNNNYEETYKQQMEQIIQTSSQILNYQNFIKIEDVLDIMHVPENTLLQGQSFQIRKKVLSTSNSKVYNIICGIDFSDYEEPMFTCYGEDLDGIKLENSVIFPIPILKNSILTQVCFEDIIPTTLPVQSCQSLYLFLKYLIAPFIIVDPEKSELKFFPKAPGILPDREDQYFLGHEYTLFLHHLEGFCFKLILQSKQNQETCTRIDVEFNKESFNLFFRSLVPSNQQIQEEEQMHDLFQMTDSGKEVQTENKELKHRKIIQTELENYIVKQEQNQNKSQLYDIESIVPVNKEKLYTYLDDIILKYEEFIKEILQIQNFDLLCQYEQNNLTFSQFKILTSAKKTTAYYGNYDPDEKKIYVNVKNFFQSFSIQAKKIYASGHSYLEESNVEKIFGINFSFSDLQTKKMLVSFCTEKFTLAIKEKMDDQLLTAKESKFSNNPIQQVPIISGCYFRKVLTKEHYNSILTIEQIGVSNRNNGKMLGVKCTIYNPIDQQESGVFLTTNEYQWKFTNQEINRMSYKKHSVTLPFSDNLITHLFREVCTPIITEQLEVDEDFSTNESAKLSGFIINPQQIKPLPVIRLEVLFTIDNLIQFSQKDQQQQQLEYE